MNKIMKNLSKKVAVVLSSLIIAFMATNTVQATNILNTTSPSLIETSNGLDIKSNSIISGGANSVVGSKNNSIQGTGSLEKAENYVDDKLGDVVGFFQSTIKPFTYIMFIISAISILVGIVTGSKHKFAGLLGMAFSILVYVGVMYAPQIVDYFSIWLSA